MYDGYDPDGNYWDHVTPKRGETPRGSEDCIEASNQTDDSSHRVFLIMGTQEINVEGGLRSFAVFYLKAIE